MMLILDPNLMHEQRAELFEKLARLGLEAHPAGEGALGLLGPSNERIRTELGRWPGVRQVLPLAEPYRLVSRAFHPDPTRIPLGPVTVGGREVVLMAGPCAVEGREHIHRMAQHLAEVGLYVLRGGAFKPRSSPYAFQGHGIQGLRWMREAADRYGLAVVSEVMDARQIPDMLPYVDLLQVGARNMQNFALLTALGHIGKPVLLKRGFAATVQEWLLAAEYILAAGNPQVILCERGIRTFETATRNTLDVSAIPVLQRITHLPVIVDPSHAVGIRDHVIPLARAGVAAGADGLIVEYHSCPEEAWSDGPQALYPEQLGQLVVELKGIAAALGRELALRPR